MLANLSFALVFLALSGSLLVRKSVRAKLLPPLRRGR